MYGTMLCAAVALLGVKYSVQPLPGGGSEYVIQLEPLAIDSLKAGSELRSDIPSADLRDLRAFRIMMIPGAASGAPTPPAARSTQLPTAPSGSIPLPRVDVGHLPNDYRAPAVKPASGPLKAPAPLPSVVDTKPLAGQKASFLQPEPPPSAKKPDSEKKTEKKSETKIEPTPEPEPSKDYPLLTVTLAATTIGSFSGMMFFGWVAHDYRSRYRTLLARAVDATVHDDPAQDDQSQQV
jgi:hypothetical protein